MYDTVIVRAWKHNGVKAICTYIYSFKSSSKTPNEFLRNIFLCFLVSTFRFLFFFTLPCMSLSDIYHYPFLLPLSRIYLFFLPYPPHSPALPHSSDYTHLPIFALVSSVFLPDRQDVTSSEKVFHTNYSKL